MSVVPVGTVQSDFTFAHLTTTVTKPTGVAVGNVLVLFVGNFVAGNGGAVTLTINTPSGWTLVKNSSTISSLVSGTYRCNCISVFVRVATSADVSASSYTTTGTSSGDFPANSSGMASILGAYSGEDGTTPVIDSTANAASNAGSTCTGLGVTPTAAGSYVIGAIGSWESDVGPFTGLTKQVGAGDGMTYSHGAFGAGATGNLTCSCSATETWNAIVVALNPAPGGGGGGQVTKQARNAGFDEPLPHEVVQRSRRLGPQAAAVAGNPPPTLRRPMLLDEQISEPVIGKSSRSTPVSGPVVVNVPPMRRRVLVDDGSADEPFMRSRLPPQAPDSPQMVAYETSDLERGIFEEEVRARRVIPMSGPTPAAFPFAARRQMTDAPLGDERIALRSPLVTLEPQAVPPLEREPRIAEEPNLDDQIRLRPSPLVTFAAQAGPPNARARLFDDSALGDEPRRRGLPPSSTPAPSAPPIAARRASLDEPLAAEPVQEREGASQLRATDAPPLRRSAQLQESSPQDESRRGGVLVPPSGQAPSAPPAVRMRVPSDEQAPEIQLRKPWFPLSGLVPSAPPPARARALSDEQSQDALVRRPWMPVSGIAPSAPPPIRPRQAADEATADSPQPKQFAASFARVDAPPATRQRTQEEAASPELVRARAQVPVSAPPSPPPPMRPRSAQDEPAPGEVPRARGFVPATPAASSAPPLRLRVSAQDEPAPADGLRLRAAPPDQTAPAPALPLLRRSASTEDGAPIEGVGRRAWFPPQPPPSPPDAPPVVRQRVLFDEAPIEERAIDRAGERARRSLAALLARRPVTSSFRYPRVSIRGSAGARVRIR